MSDNPIPIPGPSSQGHNQSNQQQPNPQTNDEKHGQPPAAASSGNNAKRAKSPKPKSLSSASPAPENRRLLLDYMQIKKEPLPFIYVEPLHDNILEWHYVLRGPNETPYENGLYHGKLIFSNNFPFQPPAIYMMTPSGRFKPNFRLCLSISDYHPDTWNPSWSVGTVLQGILNFMLDKSPTLGSILSNDEEKKAYAFASYEFNLKDKIFCELFPDLVEEIKSILDVRRVAAISAAASAKELAIKNQSAFMTFVGRCKSFFTNQTKK